jgi:hypothetical protein
MLITAPNLLRGGRPHGMIENVVTHPAFQRRGHGRAVIGAVLDEAWQRGCRQVLLQSGRADPRVHAFHEDCGFVQGASDRLRCGASGGRGLRRALRLFTENFAGGWMNEMQMGAGRAIYGFIAPLLALRARQGNAGLNGQGRIWAAKQNELVHQSRLPPAGPGALS